MAHSRGDVRRSGFSFLAFGFQLPFPSVSIAIQQFLPCTPLLSSCIMPCIFE